MTFARPLKGLFVAGIEKITHQKNDGPAMPDLVEEIQRGPQAGARVARLEKQDVPNETKHVPRSFAGGNILFHAIRARDETNLVIIADGAKGEQGGYLGSHVALLL